jgi:hypothetical protein
MGQSFNRCAKDRGWQRSAAFHGRIHCLVGMKIASRRLTCPLICHFGTRRDTAIADFLTSARSSLIGA